MPISRTTKAKRHYAKNLGGAAIVAALLAGASPSHAEEAPLTGFYVGPILSHTALQSTVRLPPSDGGEPAPALFKDVAGSNSYLGARVGYSAVSGVLFWGLEAGGRLPLDAHATSTLRTTNSAYELNSLWDASFVGRLGLALNPQTAIYGAGGVNIGQQRISHDGHNNTRTHVSPTAGVGTEHALTDRMSVRFDWMADNPVYDGAPKASMVRWNMAISLGFRF